MGIGGFHGLIALSLLFLKGFLFDLIVVLNLCHEFLSVMVNLFEVIGFFKVLLDSVFV